MPSKLTPRLSPKVRELVATDRLARPPVGRLSGVQAGQLAAVAQRRQAFQLDVSPARAIRALSEGAKADVAIPVLEAILADRKAPLPERVAAARGLGHVATPAAEHALLSQMRAGEPRVQQEVIAALGRFAGASAGRKLGKIEAPSDLATYRQWVFAKALIAHRLGLDGPFLAEKLFVERSRGRPEQMATFMARTRTAKATTTARAKLRGEQVRHRLRGPLPLDRVRAREMGDPRQQRADAILDGIRETVRPAMARRSARAVASGG